MRTPLPRRFSLIATSSLAFAFSFENGFSALKRLSRVAAPAVGAILFQTTMATSLAAADIIRDTDYPGTAVTRLQNVHSRVKSLTSDQLNGNWEEVRRSILWAGGLRDLPTARPGLGYTGHSFNDFNHCDLTTMLGDVSTNENQGKVAGIAYSNQLGPGIKIASIEELGPGGSWSTCMLGCNRQPPQDVAHLQFHSRIAFKLVWCPPTFTTFVLVDDSGDLLATGRPTGTLPHIQERTENYNLVTGSKYATAALQVVAATAPAETSCKTDKTC